MMPAALEHGLLQSKGTAYMPEHVLQRVTEPQANNPFTEVFSLQATK